MTYGVDTSVLLRVLMGQPVALAQKVRARLKDLWRSGVKCSVCDVVVSEAYYALQHSYGISKERAILESGGSGPSVYVRVYMSLWESWGQAPMAWRMLRLRLRRPPLKRCFSLGV